MLLGWLKEAEKDGKINTDDPILTARVCYALIEGAISGLAISSHGINKSAVKPILDEIIDTFLARYINVCTGIISLLLVFD